MSPSCTPRASRRQEPFLRLQPPAHRQESAEGHEGEPLRATGTSEV